ERRARGGAARVERRLGRRRVEAFRERADRFAAMMRRRRSSPLDDEEVRAPFPAEHGQRFGIRESDLADRKRGLRLLSNDGANAIGKRAQNGTSESAHSAAAIRSVRAGGAIRSG